MAATSLFGDLDLRLDPWEVEYGSELPMGSPQEARDDDTVDPEVELPIANWRPLIPAVDLATPLRLTFVDGVRRVEARVIGRQGARLCHGAFGSFGVGSVEAGEGGAVVTEVRVDRVLALDSGQSLPGPIEVGPALTYRVVSSAKSDVNAPLARLQEEMRLAEERLARELADREGALVIADGPLTFGDPVRGGALGYIKRLFQLYVDGSLLPVLAALPAGSRSPVFALRSSQRFARYSWFVRLAPPRPGDSDLAGIVRLEVSESVGLAAARRLADATARALPRFAPSRGRDPRAPQNLLPIGALESHLRRRLGDPRLIRRRLADLIALETMNA